MFILAACGGLEENSIWTPDPPVVVPVVAAGLLPLTPGVYHGVGRDGWSGDIYVEVEVDETGRIVRIDVTDHSETPNFADPAFAAMTAAMLAGQTSGVDLHVGATVTAIAFIEAVEDALIPDAGVSLEELRAGGGDAPEPGNFTPGSFIGVGLDGWSGDIHVEVTFSETAILSIEVVHHSETPGFAYPAFDAMIPAMIAAQTSNVDIHVGATVTAHTLIDAVADAIAQSAAGAPAPAPPTPPPAAEEPEEDEQEPEEVEIEVEIPTEPRFTPATFTATVPSWQDAPLSASVTFDAYSITGISITHGDTPMFFDMVQPALTNRIIAQQSADGIAVTAGATVTHNAIITAVQNAIQQAEGTAAALDCCPADAGDAPVEEEPVVEEAPPVVEEAPPAEEPPADAGGRFTAGTFSGSTASWDGATLTASVTFDDNNIVSISITHGDTPMFFDMVEPALSNQIVANNGTGGIAVTSGATVTHNAIITAVNQAISQASN